MNEAEIEVTVRFPDGRKMRQQRHGYYREVPSMVKSETEPHRVKHEVWWFEDRPSVKELKEAAG